MLAIVHHGPKDRPRSPAAEPPLLPDGALTFGSVADALRGSRGDIVLLGACVPSGWSEQLLRAAAVDDRIATVSALALSGEPSELDRDAARVQAASQQIRPALPSPRGPCVLLRRDALDLIGWPADDDDGAALAEFGAACTSMGFLHVLADDLLVHGEDTPSDPDDLAPVARARAVAKTAIEGLSVTIDARLLDGPLGGSQVHTLALIAALAGTGSTHMRVLLGPEPGRDAQATLAALELDTLSYADAIDGAPRTDVVHRPMQVYTTDDMALLRLVGERIVVTHHDSILFHNPSYFASAMLWDSYRRVTRQALAEADRVIFSTVHARDEARRDELVSSEGSAVLPLGTDHSPSSLQAAPAALDAGDARPFLLCLGSDLRHKNRPFAIRLLIELRELGWDGRLVLAGGHAEHGSSAAEERDLLAGGELPAGAVVDLGHVSEAEREWLMRQCAAVVFASVSEGFGLPPFEAARRGVPCLFAPRSAMAELLPTDAATIVPWDAQASATNALRVLTDPGERTRHLDRMSDAAGPLTWTHFADQLIGLYESAVRAPERAVSALVAQADEREQYLRHYAALVDDLKAQLAAMGPDALALVGRDGVLPLDIQRALLAAAGRGTRAPLFALLRAAYRVGHRRRS